MMGMRNLVVLASVMLLTLAVSAAYAGGDDGCCPAPTSSTTTAAFHGDSTGDGNGDGMKMDKKTPMMVDNCPGCQAMAGCMKPFMEMGGKMDMAKTSNGMMLMLLVDDPAKAPKVHEIAKGIMKVDLSTMPGLCPVCQKMATLEKAKTTKGEAINSQYGSLLLMTSSDPEHVKMMHDMLASMQPAHEPGDHDTETHDNS
jgi:hypothetical protein